MEKKYLKLTAAGQLAIKKISVAAVEKVILERVQKEPGFVVLNQTVQDEGVDRLALASLLEKGWLRETDTGNLTQVAVERSSNERTQQNPAPSPQSPTSKAVAEPAAPYTVPPKIEVSEEDKAKSYENFMKIMGVK